jgi:uroporphyrinogen-III decarboxylase
LNEREKFLKEMNLDGDPSVRSHIHIWYDVWRKYGDRLDWLEGFSEHVTVSIERQSRRPAGSEATDVWGSRWRYEIESHDGVVIEHPIPSWSDLASYQPPSPEDFTNWDEAAENIARTRSEGGVSRVGTDHGFIFLRLTYLRGFENFMVDLAEEREEVYELTAIVENYWLEVCRRWVDAGADMISFGDDLGLQHALPISPEKWRKFIKPSYQKIFSFCRSNGVHVFHHSDGYIVDIIPDLIECGVSQLNPQDLVNGLDELDELARGKICIHLDIDRQNLTVFGSPEDIDAHILRCIQKLGARHGGLSMIWYVFPPTPIENIEAGARAMDSYASHWAS